MPQIKKTKIELKAQRDALQRFERFLPMLQLKKQQLQVELQAVQHAMDQIRAESEALVQAARPWLALLPEAAGLLPALVRVRRVGVSDSNIAGVAIPVFESLDFDNPDQDLFDTAPWLDDAQALIMTLTEHRIRGEILKRQHRLLEEELRTTSQRVNLFEKVKIPESKETIRVIKIVLGDQMTADVARGKAAKHVGGRRVAA